MRDSLLDNQLREQIRSELSSWLVDWEQYVACFAQHAGTSNLPGLATLPKLLQQARLFARLLHDTDTCAVATVLQASFFCDTPKTNHRHKIFFGLQAIADAFMLHAHSGLFSLSGVPLLSLINDPVQTFAQPSDGIAPLVNTLFSVTHPHTNTALLTIQALDLQLLEQEQGFLYVLELPWAQVLDRNLSVSGLLTYLGRNGHIFDLVAAQRFLRPEAPDTEQIVRVLYASALEPDFVEASLRLAPYQYHTVDLACVKQQQPSWGLHLASATAQHDTMLALPAKSIEDLIQEYNVAFKQLLDHDAPSTAPLSSLASPS